MAKIIPGVWWGRDMGLEPATTGITIPPQLRCLHPAEAGGGETGNLFNLSYTWVTQIKINYGVLNN